ncbi:hypothetical protein [Demequina salsinemoris]|uniref:hypothetical protein n=1 Tax=Demequina salsinemoris TaxID=577470 RepID=UPI00078163C1|nr:hypothetical protein [Demequina salsinemoris]
MNAQTLAQDITDDVIDRGTEPFRIAFGILADAVRDAHPGVAEALTDWEGAEVARLRAFALAREALRDMDDASVAEAQDEDAHAGVPWAA